MNVLVIGSGGREHAIVKKLAESPKVTKLFACPGNGGIAEEAVCIAVRATDIAGVVALAKENAIDFAVVTPDDPLVFGMVDALEAEGVRCFGPNKAAAQIEGSKLFAKELMAKYGIPTARYRAFDDEAQALAYIDENPAPIVVKADGLALGKGVTVAATREEAKDAVRALMHERVFGESGARVVIEECLEGPEVSVLTFTDGETVVPMVSSMDHKRANDGDLGANTGGMGAVAPNPYYTDEVAAECMERIFLPTVRAMKAMGRPFRGCLYFGLMLTQEGPKVIEYNCRFGDPEAQAVLPLLESDLLEIMEAVRDGRLSETEVRFRRGACCTVVLASSGYPKKYETGFPISFGEKREGVTVYHAGTKRADGSIVTSGGRVLGISAVADTLKEAVSNAYAAVDEIKFSGAYCRRDIGEKALRRK